jgi:hypothetical protein
MVDSVQGQTGAVNLRQLRPPVDLVDGTTVATDASLSDSFRLLMAGNRTLLAPTNPADGQQAVWALRASGGARTPTLTAGAGGFVLATGLSVTAVSSGLTDIYHAMYDVAADRWRVWDIAKGLT